jgi:hypothetical protein
VSHALKYQRTTNREWSARRNSSGAIPLFLTFRFEIHEWQILLTPTTTLTNSLHRQSFYITFPKPRHFRNNLRFFQKWQDKVKHHPSLNPSAELVSRPESQKQLYESCSFAQHLYTFLSLYTNKNQLKYTTIERCTQSFTISLRHVSAQLDH